MAFWSRLLNLLARSPSPSEPAVAAFPCAVCGETAATVSFVPTGQLHPLANALSATAPRLVVEGFLGELSEVVPDGGRRVYAAVEASDAAALCAVDPLWAPFYCPTCRASYCQTHWATQAVYADDYPGWYEHTNGTCPRGHTRVVDD